MKNQKKIGVVLAYISMIIHIAVGFILIPLVLRFVSTGQYGVYKLVGSVVALISVFDFGLSSTVVRYYSKYKILGDKKGQENILAICLIMFAVLAVLIAIVGMAVFFLFKPVFGASLSLAEIALGKKILIVSLINLILYLPVKIFNAVIYASEKFVFKWIISILECLVNPIAILVALKAVPSVLTVAIIQTVVNLTFAIFSVIYALAGLKVKIKLHYADKPFIKEILGFSFFVFLGMLVEQFYFKIDSIILGAFIGSGVVALYSIASTLTAYFKQLSHNVGSAFIPQVNRIATKTNNLEAINGLFIRTGRVLFYVLALVLSLFIIFGKSALNIWLNFGSSSVSSDGINFIYTISLIIMVPLIIPLTQPIASGYIEARGVHRVRAVVSLIFAILNTIVSILLVRKFGAIACAITTACSLVLSDGIFMNIYYARHGLKVGKFFGELTRIAIPLALLCVGGFYLNIIFPSYGIVILAIKIIIYLVCYLILCYILCFNIAERELVKAPLKVFKRKNETRLQQTNEKSNWNFIWQAKTCAPRLLCRVCK